MNVAGVAIVPRLHVRLRAPLGSINGRDLARRIADACLDAIAHECSTLAPSARDREDGTAERTLRALTVLDGVRVDAATEAAAWLVALARDERTVVRRASPYADLEHLTSAAAFVAICARAGARAVLAALGTAWATSLAVRCTASEARRLLALIDDRSEPTTDTWRTIKAFRDELDPVARASSVGRDRAPPGPPSGRGSDVFALLLAIRGVFAECAGAVTAARALAVVEAGSATASEVLMPPDHDRVPAADESRSMEPEDDQPLESACTGLWLLLPHLARRLQTYDDESVRAVAFCIAERLWGAGAADDPAITAFTGGVEPAALRAAVPPGVRIDRLSVAVLRDFARTLVRFENARTGYVLRAMLVGPGFVWRATGGWTATLPRSPVRIVLERAALLGAILTPWDEPTLAFVRDP
jgi:hypothetical protein